MEEGAQAWYQTQAFAILVGVVLGAAISFFATWFFKWRENVTRAQSIMVAFRGEIGAIRGGLRADVSGLMSVSPDWKAGRVQTYPRTIYDSHASHIGDLRDPVLVQQLSTFYSILQRAEMTWSSTPPQVDVLGRTLAACLGLVVLLDVSLTRQTKGLVNLNWEVTLSEQDIADQQLASEARSRWGEDAGERRET